MKSLEVQLDDDKIRINRFAERLRDLVIEARSHGIQLSMAPIEDQPELKKKNLNFQQYRALYTLPLYYHHTYLGEPEYVMASAVLDVRPRGHDETRIIQPIERIVDNVAPNNT